MSYSQSKVWQGDHLNHEPSDLLSDKQIVVLRDPSILDGLDLTEEERGVLIDNINRRLTPQAVKIRAGIRIALLFFC